MVGLLTPGSGEAPEALWWDITVSLGPLDPASSALGGAPDPFLSRLRGLD